MSNFGLNLRSHKWRWTYDEQGTDAYNVLGALECTLYNLSIMAPLNNYWNMDEMERFGFEFSFLTKRNIKDSCGQ
jgi:hypothetical protein